MLRKFYTGPPCFFLMTGITLLMISSVAGLSAYLTDVTEPLEMPFRMRYGSEFGINIHSDTYQTNASLAPDAPADLDIYLTNEGNYDVYAFVTVTTSDAALNIDEIGQEWSLLSSEGNTTTYAYGSTSEMNVLPAMAKNTNGEFMSERTSDLCEKITLDSQIDYQDGTGTITATGYAIQADELTTSDPKTIWQMIGTES